MGGRIAFVSERDGNHEIYVMNADGVPTRQSYEVFSDLSGKVDEQIERLQTILDTDLDAFTTVVHELGIPVIAT